MYVAKQAMLALMECRENNEVRHKDSIRRGTTMRGENDRIPHSRNDYYSQSYDDENEARRKAREKVWLTSLVE